MDWAEKFNHHLGSQERKMKKVAKPWGYELIWAQTDMYVGKILHVNSGQALSLQYHNVKDETIMVQTGRIQLEFFSAWEGQKNKHFLDMVPGDTFHIRPGLRHRMIARQDADIVEVSTPELDDVVRLEDRYGRSAPAKSKSFFQRIMSFFKKKEYHQDGSSVYK